MLAELLVQLEYARKILVPIAVIWGAPDSRQLPAKLLQVAILAELVGAVDACHIVFLEEAEADVLAEDVAGAAGGDAEAGFVAVGVAPHQIRKGTLMRNLLHPLYLLDVVYVVQGGRESTVHAEYLVVDDGGYWEVVEHVRKQLPHPRIAILALALSIEAIYLSNLPRLVVSADQADAVGVAELEEH